MVAGDFSEISKCSSQLGSYYFYSFFPMKRNVQPKKWAMRKLIKISLMSIPKVENLSII
jgi:hypothetical protein